MLPRSIRFPNKLTVSAAGRFMHHRSMGGAVNQQMVSHRPGVNRLAYLVRLGAYDLLKLPHLAQARMAHVSRWVDQLRSFKVQVADRHCCKGPLADSPLSECIEASTQGCEDEAALAPQYQPGGPGTNHSLGTPPAPLNCPSPLANTGGWTIPNFDNVPMALAHIGERP